MHLPSLDLFKIGIQTVSVTKRGAYGCLEPDFFGYQEEGKVGRCSSFYRR